MKRVAAAMLLSVIALAQATPQGDIAEAAKSPVTLARYVDSHADDIDWDALWNALGAKAPDQTYPLCGETRYLVYPCSTEVVTVLNPDQTILIVHSRGVRTYDVYLRYFQQPGGGGRFAGRRLALLYDNYPPHHEITRIGGKPFLKISSDLSQIGGGLAQQVEDWFDLSQPDFEPVFSFTPIGGFCCFGAIVGREIMGQAFARESDGLETIELSLHVSFLMFAGDLSSGSYLGVYERPAAAKKFTLREAYSGPDHGTAIPTKEFEGLADLNGLTNEQAIVYALSGLEKIAAGGDPDTKGWLREMLAKTKDTPEKRQLLDLLARP